METFERKAYEKLASWKDSSQGSTALLIEGARRVGKSTIAEEFGRRNYASYMLVDFSKAPDDVLGYFVDLRNDLDAFFMYLSSFYGVELHRRDSLIIFDEVQLYPKAREAIKQLVADGRYDYIETGSLVSIRENVKDILIPSEEESIRLNPMDFDEFLWALGEKPLSTLIADSFKKRRPLPDSLHRKAMRLFREYMLAGGMPQAVSKYVETHDFSKVNNVKRNILRLYRQDISKHGGSDQIRITRIFDNLVGQLSKKEKKYKLSSLDKQARFRTYEDSFIWLNEAMVVNACFNATDPHVGLALSSDNTTQKCYMADTGLLVTHTFKDKKYTDNELYRAILFDKLNINEGMLMENIVAQMLRLRRERLYFYSRSDSRKRENHMEIDFLITEGKKIAPVEVKSGNYRSHSSLDKFRKHFSSVIGNSYILYTKDVMIRDGIIHLPLYMAEFL